MTEKMPVHVGLIVDGNRRWARNQDLPTFEGHRQGAEVLKQISKHLIDKGVKYVSMYVFSTENWKRSDEEVDYLMDLLQDLIEDETDELVEKSIKLQWIGSKDGIKPSVKNSIEKAIDRTKNGTKGSLGYCFNYGGHKELIDAFKAMLDEGVKPEDVTEKLIHKYLYAPEFPDVDLIIRSSGEQRISNFMLYRAAYSEMCFIDKNWPDLTVEDIDKALDDFMNRDRRFGGNHAK